MRMWLAGAILILAAQAVPVLADDVLPWPWGTECPFPWSKIEGVWETKDKSLGRFEFEVKGFWENGTRVIDIRRYDSKGELTGQGEGVSPRGERIVRAAMTGVGDDAGNSYWAIVRSYNEKGKTTCSRAKLVTVITIRSIGDHSEDVHFILEKRIEEQKKKSS